MTTYHIEVQHQDTSTHVESSSVDLIALLGKLEGLKTASNNGGAVYRDDDVLSVIEISGSDANVILSWSRGGGEILHQGGIVGWQIVNSDGVNVHGEALDPYELQSFEILVGEAADVARAGAIAGGYRVHPVRDGEVEDPTIVEILLSASPKP